MVASVALRCLSELIERQGERAPKSVDIPAGTRVARLDAWRSSFLTAYGEHSAAKKDSQVRLFLKARTELLERKRIGINCPFAWVQQ
jgi:hypothetical protein